MAKTGPKQKTIERLNDSTVQRFDAASTEICILAGGLSKRMGRDKSRLRLGSTTMLGHIRQAAQLTGLPVRVIENVARVAKLAGHGGDPFLAHVVEQIQSSVVFLLGFGLAAQLAKDIPQQKVRSTVRRSARLESPAESNREKRSRRALVAPARDCAGGCWVTSIPTATRRAGIH